MAINPTFRNTMTAIIIVTMFLKPVCDCTVFLVVLETSKWHSSTKGVTKLERNIRIQDSWVQFNLYCSEPIELEASIVITLSSWTTPMVFGCFFISTFTYQMECLGTYGCVWFSSSLVCWRIIWEDQKKEKEEKSGSGHCQAALKTKPHHMT